MSASQGWNPGPDLSDPAAIHAPVMAGEVLEILRPRPGGRYVDGTLGLGGHAEAILKAAGGDARLIGIDRDPEALDLAKQRLAAFAGQVTFVNATFADMAEVVRDAGWEGVDGALVDLGVSSLQIDSPDRGFSFLNDGPLDMRMNRDGDEDPAWRLVNKAPVEELRRIIFEYGEEPMAGRIARAIEAARGKGGIETTLELAELVSRAYPGKRRALARNHPATKTFQALRMAVNRELEQLGEFLRTVPGILVPGGRVAVISFHSLEDRLVKNAFRHEAAACTCPPRLPVCVCGHVPRLRILTKKPLTPGEAEMHGNSRARSAKLRGAERLGAGAQR